jgi:arabinose-5-phosphate isomerase
MVTRLPRYNDRMNTQSASLSAMVLQQVKETLQIEAEALLAAHAQVGTAFVEAVQCIEASSGRVVVMGMGKSGHIGRKIAATLASTGTPAFFVHPAEASHGDLGMVTRGDVLLILSNSGESDELLVLLPVFKRLGVSIVAITGGLQSSLAQHADVVINSQVAREACPHNLAPTASTTVQLALGDALALALLKVRGFQPEDFARSHPGGALGRRLLTHVHDVMRSGEQVPAVPALASLTELMHEMSAKGLGATAVVDAQRRLMGIFTDGDLRRLIEKETQSGRADGLLMLHAHQVMHHQPRSIGPSALAAQAAEIMEQHRINSMMVVDEAGVLVGALNSHDLMRAKVI